MLTLGLFAYAVVAAVAAVVGAVMAFVWSRRFGNARRRKPKPPGQPHQFIHLSIEYFISARQMCFRPSPVPLAAHLFHHAFEMLFKYALLNRHTQDHLAWKYRHGLTKLWNAFKAETGDKRLAAFDDVVRRLDKWEAIRYPTFPRGSQAMAYAPIKAAVQVQVQPGVDRYDLVLEEMD